MSFSHDIRECIRNSLSNDYQKFACLYGILLFGRTVTREEIELKSESEVFRSLFPSLLQHVCKDSASLLSMENKPRKNGSMMTIYKITNEKAVTAVRRKFHLHEERRIDMRNLSKNRTGAFLGGVFLICGSMTDPTKEYHLEFSPPTETLCSDLCQILSHIGLHPNVMRRKYNYSVYLKVSEEIEDFLTFIGAQKCTLRLIDIKIDKEVTNQATRRTNCDIANINKIISAAEKQCQAIEEIIRHDDLKNLSPELQELALLRLENPHLSLADLGEMLRQPIGRSGVNHRFRKISAIAETYQNHIEEKS